MAVVAVMVAVKVVEGLMVIELIVATDGGGGKCSKSLVMVISTEPVKCGSLFLSLFL
jgi:hypothetical protein